MSADDLKRRIDAHLPGRNSRRSARRDVNSIVQLELKPGEVRGTTRDLSDNGMLLFSGERLPVQVTFEEEGRRIQVTGHLVRVQRTSQEFIAYAIEFDESLGESPE
ncbi:PilZ domain-containing protein [Engelhardtia mirabilis]|uniref:PilZ domain protein n=1 Tax=Engelhardtia mirabilis TaxID=2528011 RepID=A0A518BND0_9BACT|nr:PilZ domain protein [Planctomycetes bacterium Pla133]QDV02809.1 PilZ domain protein [Planctomycetes bacterium Pla86]